MKLVLVFNLLAVHPKTCEVSSLAQLIRCRNDGTNWSMLSVVSFWLLGGVLAV